MSTKKRLSERVLSFVLACIMLCSLFMTDGFIMPALAARPSTVEERLDWIALRGCFGRSGETYKYRIEVKLEAVGDDGIRIAEVPKTVKFDVTFKDTLTAAIENSTGADVKCKLVEGDEILTFYNMFSRDELQKLCNDAQANYAGHCNSNPGFSGMLGMDYANFMGGSGGSNLGKYFRKTVKATLLSVEAAADSDLMTSWNSGMTTTLLHFMQTWGANGVSVDPKDGISTDNTRFRNIGDLSGAGLSVTGKWLLTDAIQVDLLARYSTQAPPGTATIDPSALLWNKFLFRLFTQSSILSNPNNTCPSSDSDFEAVSGLDNWDGFLPYRAVFAGVNKAYNNLGCTTDGAKQALSGGVTLEAAKAFEKAYNATIVGGQGKIHAVESTPGLFYEIVINNASPNYNEDPSDLVRNISGSYNATTDEYTINYELRSTNNSVYFMFFPVKYEYGTIRTTFNLNPGYSVYPGGFSPGTRPSSTIYEDVDVSVSVMKLPKGVPELMERYKKSTTFSACYRGDAFNNRGKFEDERTGYFYNLDRYYTEDCCGSGKIGPYSTSQSADPHASGQIGANFCLPSGPASGYAYTDKETLNKLFAQDASTPKLTWSGTAMFGEGGFPNMSVSLWDAPLSGENPPSNPGASTVILDWNMNGYPALELQKGETSVNGIKIDGTGEGGFGTVPYANVKAGDKIWFDGSYLQLSLLAPGLEPGADIPYNTLKEILQTKADGTVDTDIDVLTEAQYESATGGVYVKMEGTRSSFTVYIDRNGEIKRAPAVKTMRKLGTYHGTNVFSFMG